MFEELGEYAISSRRTFIIYQMILKNLSAFPPKKIPHLDFLEGAGLRTAVH